MTDELQPMPDDWTRALVVVAHPDDLEYGGSAAMTRWTAEGRGVAYLLVTRGESGIDILAPAQCRRSGDHCDPHDVVPGRAMACGSS